MGLKYANTEIGLDNSVALNDSQVAVLNYGNVQIWHKHNWQTKTGHRSEPYTQWHSSGLTGWNDKWGSTAAPYCDHCGASWGSKGHCTWTTTEYKSVPYNYQQCSLCGATK